MFKLLTSSKTARRNFLIGVAIITGIAVVLLCMQIKSSFRAEIESVKSPIQLYTEYQPESYMLHRTEILAAAADKRREFEGIINETSDYNQAALAKLKLEALELFEERFRDAISQERCFDGYPVTASETEQILWLTEYFNNLDTIVFPEWQRKLDSIKM